MYAQTQQFFELQDRFPKIGPQKLDVVLSFDQKMFSIQIFDLRTRKIQARSFVSICELFEPLDFLVAVTSLGFYKSRAVYSIESDVLSIEVSLHFRYREPEAENMRSVIESELRAGRDDRSKLTWIYETFSTFEEKKLRFKVINVLRADRRVEVETIGYKNHSSSLIIPNGIMLYVDRPSELKIEMIRRDKEGTKINQKKAEFADRDEVKEGRRTSVFRLRKGAEFRDSGVKKVIPIEENLILVVGLTKLVIIDTAAKKVIFSFDYKLPLPTTQTNTLYKDRLQCDEGLIIFILQNNARRCINVSKRVLNQQKQGQEVFPYKHIASMDLTCFEDLHSIKELLNIRKLTKNLYDLRLRANWMESQETTTTTERIFWLRFRLKDHAEHSWESSSEIIDSHLDPLFIEPSWISNYYTKGENWYQTATFTDDRKKIIFSRKKAPFDINASNCTGEVGAGQIIEKKEITSFHFHEEIVCTVLKINETASQIKIYELKRSDEQDQSNEPQLIKSGIVLTGKRVFFDDLTDQLRIFCLIPESYGTRIKVLGGDLEVQTQYNIRGISNSYYLRLVSKDRLYLEAKEKSVLVDLSSKTVREIVNERGYRHYGLIYGC